MNIIINKYEWPEKCNVVYLMIMCNVITSESDINVHMSNGFTIDFSKYRTQGKHCVCLKSYNTIFTSFNWQKTYVAFSLSLSSLCFQINNGV